MKRRGQIAVVALLAGAVIVIAAVRGREEEPGAEGPRAEAAESALAVRVPRLVDLGAGKCIPCKAMAPILDQLRTDYAGRLEVTFIDVWQKPDEAQAYRIQMIPTQIFYGADGRELARHEGFISREEILALWKAVGVEL
jgi:thioredoxin 1